MPNLAIFKVMYRLRKLVALYVAAETAIKLTKFAMRHRPHRAR